MDEKNVGKSWPVNAVIKYTYRLTLYNRSFFLGCHYPEDGWKIEVFGDSPDELYNSILPIAVNRRININNWQVYVVLVIQCQDITCVIDEDGSGFVEKTDEWELLIQKIRDGIAKNGNKTEKEQRVLKLRSEIEFLEKEISATGGLLNNDHVEKVIEKFRKNFQRKIDEETLKREQLWNKKLELASLLVKETA